MRASAIRLPAPLYADPSTVASMRSDSVISRTLEAGRHADVMLFGVGAVSTSTTLFEGSFLDTRMLDELESLGAVGEIGGRFFDAHGAPVDTELQQRAVSVPLEDIRDCEKTHADLQWRRRSTTPPWRASRQAGASCWFVTSIVHVGCWRSEETTQVRADNERSDRGAWPRRPAWSSPPAVRARAAWGRRTTR